jgi:hypothetical protein
MITQELLHKLLLYDPNIGIFTWRDYPSCICKSGDIAGNLHPLGYIKIGINYKSYFAHELAFIYMTGKSPQAFIDHINGEKTDNRWKNLREATASQNQCNRGKQLNNNSGYKGIINLKLKNGKHYGYRARVRYNRELYQKDFSIDELEIALIWLREIRSNLHKEFTNHG